MCESTLLYTKINWIVKKKQKLWFVNRTLRFDQNIFASILRSQKNSKKSKKQGCKNASVNNYAPACCAIATAIPSSRPVASCLPGGVDLDTMPSKPKHWPQLEDKYMNIVDPSQGESQIPYDYWSCKGDETDMEEVFEPGYENEIIKAVTKLLRHRHKTSTIASHSCRQSFCNQSNGLINQMTYI